MKARPVMMSGAALVAPLSWGASKASSQETGGNDELLKIKAV
jgi:hypothetical protein